MPGDIGRNNGAGCCSANGSTPGAGALGLVADSWFATRHSVKRKTREADRAAWTSQIAARFGDVPVASITTAEIVGWAAACQAIGRPTFRVHDLRHTCASLWLGNGADPKVVQRVLGHASAAMTMDLYGHLFDHNLWAAAERVGGTTPAPQPLRTGTAEAPAEGLGL